LSIIKEGEVTKRILVVDDEPQIVSVLKMRLEDNGYEVISASDGEEGLEKAKDLKPDLIILDIIMPKMAGSKVAVALKEDDQLSRIPVIFLTCLSEGLTDKQGSEKIGGNLFLAKPFEADELLLMVDNVLKK